MWGKDIDAVCMCIPPIVTILVSMAKVVTTIRFEPEVRIMSLSLSSSHSIMAQSIKQITFRI